MRSYLLFFYLLSGSVLLNVITANAGELSVSVEIPRLDVAEYHKPYVAVWLESENGENTNLAVWYQLDERGNKSDKGEEWLKDLRQWWRRIGRNTDMPIDVVSGATRVAGTHQLHFTEGKAPLNKLTPGSYTLVVEAVREVGDREQVKIPFTWPVQTVVDFSAEGSKELAKVKVTLSP